MTLLHIWNHQIIDQNIFQSLLKLDDVTPPVFNKSDPTSVKNYRPVSVLPNVSKSFERIMLKQILEQMNKYLSQNLWIYKRFYRHVAKGEGGRTPHLPNLNKSSLP